MSDEDLGKRAARSVTKHAAAAIEAELPMVRIELVMEEFNPTGGKRVHRISPPTHMGEELYIITEARYVDRIEAARLMPPHDPEAADRQAYEVTNPPRRSPMPRVNWQGPQGDPIGKLLPDQDD